MTRSLRLVAQAALLFSASALAACGGTTQPVDPDGTGGSGGSGTGGAGTGGSPDGSCEYQGRTYPEGTFPSPDGCNVCSCSNGQLGCTGLYCPPQGCSADGITYQVGESFPAGDGCNVCACTGTNTIECTLQDCATCEDVASDFRAELDTAKECDPGQPNQCTQLLTAGPACGAGIYVNPANEGSLSTVEALRTQYREMGCDANEACAPSLPPVGSYCSASGRCETLYQGDGASCRVEGITYPTGSTNVPDPFSCNTCDCVNGQLVNCTDVACDEPCPPNAVPGTQCASCGPTDGCDEVEHTCLSLCAEGCVSGICLDGVCRDVCG